MLKYDVIVIGGGLLGCFTARALMQYRLKVALLEAREDVLTGVSRANSAIVYSGIDTKPGTLKSQMCVKAAQTFEQLCRTLGVRYSQCGSLMICYGPKGEEKLRKKYAQGLENGVRGLRLLSGNEVLALEPHLNPGVTLGLFAPEAGTVIPWELGLAAAENAVHNGADFHLNTKVNAISRDKAGYRITSGNCSFLARGVVNCAGLFADEILEKVQAPSVRIFPAAGDYYVLDTKADGIIRHVIFHETEEKGKGLTLVPTVDGNILVGPSKVSGGEKEGFATSPEGLDSLSGLAGDVIPALSMTQVIRTFGTVRPNPFYVHRDPVTGDYVREDKGISSFIVHESESNPAFLSLVGIKTPGLTCANELGTYAAEKMAALLDHTQTNPAFEPSRPAPVRLGDVPIQQRAQLAKDNPAYGKIICRCRGISEGEIIDSIHRVPGAVTVDGVKRRTGGTSGRCQGSFCTQRIIEIIARELNRAPEDVYKDGPGSFLIGGVKNGL